MPGKHELVDGLGVLRFAHHHTAARAAEGLVRRRGHEICIGDGIRMQACGDQARDVGNVDHEVGADRLGDRLKFWKVQRPGIGTGADHDHARAAFFGKLADGVKVDGFRLPIDPVRERAKNHSGEIDFAAVGQMASLRQVHPENRVSGLEHRQVGGHIGLRTGVRLNVHMLGAENLLAALNREVFDCVHMLATAVVPLAGIPFRILVRHQGTLGGQDGGTGEVLRGDQEQLVSLPFFLGIDGGIDLGIRGL